MRESKIQTFALPALMTLAAGTLYGLPPTTGAQWWSTDQNLNCSTMHSLVYQVPLASGGNGYACGVTGSFVWFSAGGNWTTNIRMAAPSSAVVGVQYVFFDNDGNRVALDTLSGAARTSADSIGMVLNANQPSDVRLLGASSDAPQYNRTQTGSVFGLFLCPDAPTCATVVPQLLYSSLSKPWSLSVPIAWDNSFSSLQPPGVSKRWSAAGINDATHFISFAVYNQSPMPIRYTVRVYNRDGSLAGEGMTPFIGPAGTQGFLLGDVITSTLPPGILKVTAEGNGLCSAVFLQFNGESATSLQTTADALPGASGASVRTAALE